MVDRPTKRQPVAIAVIEAGTTIRLVSGNHEHGIANVDVLVRKAQPCRTACGWVQQTAGIIHCALEADALVGNAVTYRLRLRIKSPPDYPLQHDEPQFRVNSAAHQQYSSTYDRAQGQYESSPGPLDWIVACMLSCVHACSENSEAHPRDLRWANGLWTSGGGSGAP